MTVGNQAFLFVLASDCSDGKDAPGQGGLHGYLEMGDRVGRCSLGLFRE